MAKALIAIGVGNTSGGGFPRLRGAVNDAKAFYAWGKTQGFDCKLFVDERKKVRFADVFDALQTFVKDGIYSQIVVYYSGHGILVAPECELWLLSGAPEIPSEAINVRGSIDRARASGVEHVVFISDACRSLPTDMTQASLSVGNPLFPHIHHRPPLPEIDVFYATLPGDVAHEVPPDPTSQRDRGLMTQCLLEALEGRVPEVIHSFDEAGQASSVVPCRPLKTWLTAALPLAAAAVSLQVRQLPDVRVESDPARKYLAKVAAPPSSQPSSAELAYGASQMTTLAAHEPAVRRRLIPSNASSGTRRIGRARGAALSIQINPAKLDRREAAITRILNSTGAPRPGASISIKGAVVRSVVCSEHAELLTDSRDSWIEHESEAPLALRFESGSGFIVSPLPGYLTTVVVEDGRIATVNYTPASGWHGHDGLGSSLRELEERRAAAAVDALNGLYSLDNVESRMTEGLRCFGRIDPTLAIYASYAYARAGQFDEVVDIYSAMAADLQAVPFDVAMLAAGASEAALPAAAPGMPLLTQGWLMLDRFRGALPDALFDAREFLEPSLWATFSDKGMNILEAHVGAG